MLLEEQRKTIAEYSGTNSYTKQREQLTALVGAVRERKEREVEELRADVDALRRDRSEKSADFAVT